ncbi:hypothetical protein EMN47_20225 [Prolixibacteraceae bacterium JC049]|nr:hypothetical protein [Prolixibacteraceae bacterium JC049]
MTRYLYIISLCVAMVASFTIAQAQSTALTPAEGATHTYRWGDLVPGDNYEFYLTADASGSTVLDDSAVAEFDFVGSPTGNVGQDATVFLSINWNTGAAANIYYLWFKVTSVQNGCSNRRYVRITPQSNSFDVLAENIPVDVTESCPNIASSNGFNPVAGQEDTGTTLLRFKVRRVNGTDNPLTAEVGDTYNWSFTASLTSVPDWANNLAIVSVEGSGNAISFTDNGNGSYAVSNVAGSIDEVIVTVKIDNLEGGSQVVSMLLNNMIEDTTNLNDSDSNNDRVDHTIKVLPEIGTMNGV